MHRIMVILKPIEDESVQIFLKPARIVAVVYG
jgi:hypothetical protein